MEPCSLLTTMNYLRGNLSPALFNGNDLATCEDVLQNEYRSSPVHLLQSSELVAKETVHDCMGIYMENMAKRTKFIICILGSISGTLLRQPKRKRELTIVDE